MSVHWLPNDPGHGIMLRSSIPLLFVVPSTYYVLCMYYDNYHLIKIPPPRFWAMARTGISMFRPCLRSRTVTIRKDSFLVLTLKHTLANMLGLGCKQCWSQTRLICTFEVKYIYEMKGDFRVPQ
jgi:hypothetical protein